MIVYLDTSALVKRYFQEPFTAEVLAKWKEAEAIVTSAVAYAETLAAMYRKQRQDELAPNTIRDLARSFQADWQTIIRVEVCEALNPYIDNVLQNHPLRGFDAVHLASALLIGQQLSAPLFFACFDQQLNQAARENGLPVF